MVAVGQIWEYRRDLKKGWSVSDKYIGKREALNYVEMAWEIVSGEFIGENLEWLCRVVRDKNGFLGVVEHKFSENVFEEGRFRLIYDPAYDEGVYCMKCNRYCEYAYWAPGFKCWGCRNGF